MQLPLSEIYSGLWTHNAVPCSNHQAMREKLKYLLFLGKITFMFCLNDLWLPLKNSTFPVIFIYHIQSHECQHHFYINCPWTCLLEPTKTKHSISISSAGVYYIVNIWAPYFRSRPNWEDSIYTSCFPNHQLQHLEVRFESSLPYFPHLISGQTY